MDQPSGSDKLSMRFLAFANDKEDAEKEAKLREVAKRIEQAIAKEKALSELVDCPAQYHENAVIDLANDHRSLYERLQEQRDKKKSDIEESQKLSNLITKLDEDDVSYLNEVAKKEREDEIKKRLEVQDALEAKKRLDEQKLIDKEAQMKESLLGGPRNKHIKSSLSIPKISSILKIKAKPIMAGKSSDKLMSQTKTSECSVSTPCVRGPPPNQPKKETIYHPVKKRIVEQSAHVKVTKDVYKIEETGNEHDPVQDCTCPKGVTKTAGVLPCLPIVKEVPSLDSDDTDYSDDEINVRLVPRLGPSHRKG